MNQFKFIRHKRHYDVWVLEESGSGTNCSAHWKLPLMNLAEAKAWAKQFAAAQDFPYVEWMKPAPQAPGELRRSEVERLIARVEFCDQQGDELVDTNPEGAARAYMGAASLCERLIRLQPGEAIHNAQAAASYVRAALDVLQAWHVRLLDTKRTDGLKLIKNEPPTYGVPSGDFPF